MNDTAANPNSTTPLMLPPVLCGSVEHYIAVRRATVPTAIDWGRRFDKRFKDTHRFTIADTRGTLDLTVPIAKPESSRDATWGDIRLSTHGNWWDVHRIALESSYGRTPYFDFYIDDLLPLLTPGVEDRYPLLRDLSDAWDSWIRRTLLLPAPLSQSDGSLSSADFTPPSTPLTPYWQVRQDKLGFIPNLSIVDLIFNLGPEAVIYLDNAAATTASTSAPTNKIIV